MQQQVSLSPSIDISSEMLWGFSLHPLVSTSLFCGVKADGGDELGSRRMERLGRGDMMVREWGGEGGRGGKSGCAWEKAALLFPYSSTTRQPLNPVSLGYGMLAQNFPSRNLCLCSWAAGNKEDTGCTMDSTFLLHPAAYFLPAK